MTNQNLEACFVPSGQEKWINIFTDKVAVRMNGDQTGGAFFVVEQVSPPGGGVPPHVHQNEDELILVLEGEATFILGEKKIAAKKGDLVFLPRGVPHGFMNTGQSSSRGLAVVMPAGFEKFFYKLEEASKKSPPTLSEVNSMLASYGITVLPPPGN